MFTCTAAGYVSSVLLLSSSLLSSSSPIIIKNQRLLNSCNLGLLFIILINHRHQQQHPSMLLLSLFSIIFMQFYCFKDEDSLCNKLCTFTVTQKEFMNQHWYHCHTCKMNDGVGVCTVCAKVCHKDHDISYAKYGSFFCDCGAKEDGSCIVSIEDFTLEAFYWDFSFSLDA